MKNGSGFTLIELMIVVGIIATLAAIAIPNLLRSRQTANEGAAVGTMRTISAAEASFQTMNQITDGSGMGQYGTLVELANPPRGGIAFIDEVLGAPGGIKSGYTFVVTPGIGNPPSYVCTGISTSANPMKNYFVDDTAVIRFKVGAPAVAGDTPI